MGVLNAVAGILGAALAATVIVCAVIFAAAMATGVIQF